MKIESVSKKLHEKDLDAFLTRQNARYLAGTPSASAVIIAESKTVLICGRLDFDRARKESGIKDVRPYARTEVPLRDEEKEDILFGKLGEAIGSVLNEVGATKVGYDRLNDEILKDIKETHGGKYQEELDLIWDLRKTKTPQEIKWLKKSAEIARKGIERAAELIEPGRTELEIAAEVEYRMRKLGSGGTPFDTILASGENSGLPHTEATGKELAEEELVMVDLGAKWNGYKSDMTRTFTISPSSRQKRLFETARKAQEAALQKVEAGVEAREVDLAAREVFKREGYEKFCLHGAGHGIGLDIHESPSLDPSSDDTLKENMVITVEPGVYVQDVGGARFEDVVIVKEDGYEKLTSL